MGVSSTRRVVRSNRDAPTRVSRLADQLADPGRRDPQALGCPAEMQLVGGDQEGLELGHFDHRKSIFISVAQQ